MRASCPRGGDAPSGVERAASLQARLLGWVMLPLLVAVAVDGWIGFHEARNVATVVQDRLLLGSARIVAEQLHVGDDGGLPERIPPAALELFESGEADRVYYRVTTDAGRIVSGYAELPLPTGPLPPETPVFFDVVVRGEAVRAVAYRQPVLASAATATVVVEIAQTLNGSAAFARALWLRAVGQQVLLLALAALLVRFGLRRGLRPLLRLRDTVAARQPASIEPLPAGAVPVELSPLVEAIDDYARRLDRYAGAQRVFVQNAAHQLRTPLTILTTQVSYALRAADDAGRHDSLVAIRRTVLASTRLVNQLLTLSAVEAQPGGAEAGPARTDLGAVVRGVLEDLGGHAQAREIDLGFEAADAAVAIVAAPRLAVREIAVNLVDNAIRYTPPGGIVTTRIECTLESTTLTVEDDGPGIPPEERERVFERFHRLHDGDSQGSGLGLPIVREFAGRVGASVELRTSASGRGLTVVVRFPPAPG